MERELTVDDVIVIRDARESGVSISDLCASFDLSESYVRAICAGKPHRHMTKEIREAILELESFRD